MPLVPFRSEFKPFSLLSCIVLLSILVPTSSAHVLNVKLKKNRGASVWKSLRSNSLKLRNAVSQKEGDAIDISNFMDVQVMISVKYIIDGHCLRSCDYLLRVSW